MYTSRSIIFVFYALLALLLPPSLTLAGDDKPDLSGIWQFNQAMSDDPKEIFKKTRKKMRGDKGSGGWRSGGGHRGAGRRSARGGFGDGMKRDRGTYGGTEQRPQMKGVLTAEILQITLTETEIKFVTGAEATEIFLIDGRGTPLDEELTVVLAGWEGDQMVVEKTTGGGRKTFERYTVSPDGLQLHVAISIERSVSTKPIKIRRIFDRVGTKEMSSDEKNKT